MSNRKNDDPRIVQIGEKLRKLRKERGFSNYIKFANEYDLDKSQYARLEGGVNFKISSLLRLLEIHEISLDAFFSDEEEFQKIYTYTNPSDSE